VTVINGMCVLKLRQYWHRCRLYVPKVLITIFIIDSVSGVLPNFLFIVRFWLRTLQLVIYFLLFNYKDFLKHIH